MDGLRWVNDDVAGDVRRFAIAAERLAKLNAEIDELEETLQRKRHEQRDTAAKLRSMAVGVQFLSEGSDQ